MREQSNQFIVNKKRDLFNLKDPFHGCNWQPSILQFLQKVRTFYNWGRTDFYLLGSEFAMYACKLLWRAEASAWWVMNGKEIIL